MIYRFFWWKIRNFDHFWKFKIGGKIENKAPALIWTWNRKNGSSWIWHPKITKITENFSQNFHQKYENFFLKVYNFFFREFLVICSFLQHFWTKISENSAFFFKIQSNSHRMRIIQIFNLFFRKFRNIFDGWFSGIWSSDSERVVCGLNWTVEVHFF